MASPNAEKPATAGTVNGLQETYRVGKLEPLLIATDDAKTQAANHAQVRHRLTREIAEAQAEKIRSYWRRRGVMIDAWVEQFHLGDRFEWRVRSTLRLCPAEERR